jgi:hypothetical protein
MNCWELPPKRRIMNATLKYIIHLISLLCICSICSAWAFERCKYSAIIRIKAINISVIGKTCGKLKKVDEKIPPVYSIACPTVSDLKTIHANNTTRSVINVSVNLNR